MQVAERVDLHPVRRSAAQEAVVLRLDARPADAVALLDAAIALVLELLRADLADVAEQVRAELLVRVLAQEDRARPSTPREVLLALLR